MKCQNSITSNIIYKTEYQIEPNPYKKNPKQWPSIKKIKLENKEKVTTLIQTENTQFVFLISQPTPRDKKKERVNENTPIQYLVVHVRKNGGEVEDQIGGGSEGGGRRESRSCSGRRREANRGRRRATNSLGNRWAEIIFENGGSLPAHYGRHVSLPPPLLTLSPSSLSPTPSLSFTDSFSFFTSTPPHPNPIILLYNFYNYFPQYTRRAWEKVKEMVIIIITFSFEIREWERERQSEFFFFFFLFFLDGWYIN